MKTESLVLVDTCMWIPFFNRPHSTERRIIDELLDDDRVAIVGPIVAEILLGFRRDDHADWVASSLRGVHEIAVDFDLWRSAARLGRHLTTKGQKLPLTDLVIGAVAIKLGCFVFTIDPHFDTLEDLKRYPNE